MDIRGELKSLIERATQSEDIKLDVPTNHSHGDYATNIALVIAKRQNRNPIEVAGEIAAKLKEQDRFNAIVQSVEIAPPGFINFWLTETILALGIDKYLSTIDFTGAQEKKKIVVEYSSPNIAKPFGIGHFRSTVIGDAVANLLEAVGNTVHRDNHLGDWGTQFGKQIYAIKTWGDEKLIEESENPVKELVDLYVKFHEEAEKDESLNDRAREWFKRLEDGDAEARRLWEKCVDWSLGEFKSVYDILNVRFTENDGVGYGESYFEPKMAKVLEELDQKGLLKEGEGGAKLVFFADDKLPPLMITKKDGTSLYATRDLAADKFRLDTYGDNTLIINEVGAEQSLYFSQLFELEQMLGWVKAGQRVHVKHGLFRFTDRKMSTRKGDIVWLNDVIDEAIARARSLGSDKKLAPKVAVGALKWNDLKREPVKDIVFEWDQILAMDGNSGPYLQYTHARAKSILGKVDFRVPEKLTISEPLNDKEKSLARVLFHFRETVQDAAKFYSPHMLANYLFVLAQEFNSFYNSERMIGSERESARLELTAAVANVIATGLGLLGIDAPDKM